MLSKQLPLMLSKQLPLMFSKPKSVEPPRKEKNTKFGIFVLRLPSFVFVPTFIFFVKVFHTWYCQSQNN
jgi:hypothetical protein